MKKTLLLSFCVGIAWLISTVIGSSRGPESGVDQVITIPNQVSALASSKTQLYVGYGDGRLEVWQVSPPKKLYAFIAHDGAIRKIRVNEETSECITVGARGSIARWDRDWHLIKRHRFTDRHLNDAILGSSENLIVGGDKGHLSQVGAKPWRIQGIHNLAVFGLALDPTRKHILSVGTTNTLNLWSVADGENVGYIPLDSLWGHTINIINDEAWVGDEQGRIQGFNLATNTPTGALKVCSSRIITSAASNSLLALGCENGEMSVIDTAKKHIVSTQKLLQTPIFALTFFDTGLVVGSTGPTMRFVREYDKTSSEEINLGGMDSWGNSVPN